MNSFCDETILRDTYYLSAYGQRLYGVCNPGNKTSIIKAYFKKTPNPAKPITHVNRLQMQFYFNLLTCN